MIVSSNLTSVLRICSSHQQTARGEGSASALSGTREQKDAYIVQVERVRLGR